MVTVVIYSELLKLLICVGVYHKKFSFFKFYQDVKNGLRVCALYMIPAFLYCLYNNLAYINLANFDPTTYFILLQFRNVITGVFYQILFKKQLSFLQWISLAILTLGCIVKEFKLNTNGSSNFSFTSFLSYEIFMIFIQIMCSCFAGVYNEYLLKDSGKSIHILIQNVYMYFDSFICNVFLLLLTSNVQTLFDYSSLQKPIVIAILVNGSLAGITTSFFLKSLNSILKTFASTMEIIISAILCYFIFNTAADIFTILSILLIFIAVYIYALYPITHSSSKEVDIESHCDDIGEKKLLLINK